VPPDLDDLSRLNLDQLAGGDVELAALVLRGAVLHRDDIVLADRYIQQLPPERPAGERADLRLEVADRLSDRRPASMIAGDRTLPREVPDRFRAKQDSIEAKSRAA
jgi:hypothetical protein